MPLFLTLRDMNGNGLATAMLPPGGKSGGACIIVGPGNADPYIDHGPRDRGAGAIISASVWTAPIAIPIAAEQEIMNGQQT